MREPEEPLLLHEFLIRAAQRYGSAPAVLEDEKILRFEQLAEQAMSLAAAMTERGIQPGDRVALLLPKSAEAIVALYATLLAGGMYVPIEPRWPPERIDAVLADCRPAFLVAGSAKTVAGRIPSLNFLAAAADPLPQIVDLRDRACLTWNEAMQSRGAQFVPPAVDPEAPALILCTSGSTGRPKGVTLSHKAVRAFVRWTAEEFQVDSRDRLACPSPLSFDLSTFDIFDMAIAGAACVIVPDPVVWMPRFLAQFISERRITAWYSVPSVLSGLAAEKRFLQERYPDLRCVLFAGEVLPGRDLARLRSVIPHSAFCNLYGPTETNVVTWHRVPPEFDPDSPIPIGRSCPYARVAIDPEDVEYRDGKETGELLAAGDSLMLEYWKRPDETTRAFSILSRGADTKQRYYRTGDRVSLDPATGLYSFIGRKDRQVKRRGYRIELGEIESALKRHPLVLEAAAISRQESALRTSIHAFIRTEPPSSVSLMDVRSHCALYLPEYMMPDQIVFLPGMPRSSRGKIDYEALAGML